MAGDSEPLIALQANELITVIPAYAARAIPGALDKIYVRAVVFDMLLAAARELKAHGAGLCVVDAWRPFCVQAALYDRELSRLEASGCENPLKTARKYISLPSCTPGCISPHLTGGSVDVIPVINGAVPDCGSWFDDFSSAARFGQGDNHWQRLVRSAMELAGFSSYDEEWWHFDFGNSAWAAATGQREVYQAAWPKEAEPLAQICGSPLGRVLLVTDSQSLSLLELALKYAEEAVNRTNVIEVQMEEFCTAVARYGFWVAPA